MNSAVATANDRPAAAAGLVRGVARLLDGLGYRVLAEFPLGNGRRVDVAGLDRRGSITVVEVKSSLADFRADGKWPEYLEFCDRFYFAVAADFPLAALPEDTGVIVADAYQGAIVRPAPPTRLNAARRKALTVRFARTAAARLHGLLDPAGLRQPVNGWR